MHWCKNIDLDRNTDKKKKIFGLRNAGQPVEISTNRYLDRRTDSKTETNGQVGRQIGRKAGWADYYHCTFMINSLYRCMI